MKKLLLGLLLVPMLLGAQIVTPKLGLTLPPRGATNWDQTINTNFTILDTTVGILQTPFQGTWNSGVTYAKGQQVNFNGNLYYSLANFNINNQPNSSPLQWVQVTGSSGFTTSLCLGPNANTADTCVWRDSTLGAGFFDFGSSTPNDTSGSLRGARFLGGAGSAAAPSLSFSGATGNGFFWPGGGSTGLAVNGNQVFNFGANLQQDGTAGTYCFTNGNPFSIACDTGLTRISSGVLGVGSGVKGNAGGSLVTLNSQTGGSTSLIPNAGYTVSGSGLSGSVNQISFENNYTLPSSATGNSSGFASQPLTAAASFTSANYYHFIALDMNKGSGSTLTNQYGFYVMPLAAGTNNFGFFNAGAAPNNLGSGITTMGALQLNSAAPNGHILVGNATSYVDSTSMPVADIAPGTNGQCVITSGGASVWGACSGNSSDTILTGAASSSTVNTASTSVQNFSNTFTPSGTQLPNTTGSKFRLTSYGTYSQNTAATTIEFWLVTGGSTSALGVGPITLNTVLGHVFTWFYTLECTNTASATYSCVAKIEITDNTASPQVSSFLVQFGSGVAYSRNSLGIGVQFSTSSTSNTATQNEFQVHQLN